MITFGLASLDLQFQNGWKVIMFPYRNGIASQETCSVWVLDSSTESKFFNKLTSEEVVDLLGIVKKYCPTDTHQSVPEIRLPKCHCEQPNRQEGLEQCQSCFKYLPDNSLSEVIVRKADDDPGDIHPLVGTSEK